MKQIWVASSAGRATSPGFDPLATHNMKMALRGVGAFFVLKI